MLHRFAAKRPDGAFTKSPMKHTSLPKGPHEVTILVAGAAVGARYQLGTHERVATFSQEGAGELISALGAAT